MSKKSIQLNCLTDIYNALELDLITPSQAIKISCKALKMIDMRFDNEPIIKEQVLKQILHLDLLIKKYSEVPIFFGQQNDLFDIKEMFNPN
jgi:hypothetical protein